MPIYTPRPNLITPHDAQLQLSDPLPSQPTPHLDAVYAAVSGAPDIGTAFTAQYRAELGQRADRPLPLVSITGKAAVMSTLIREGYPPSMHHFADEKTIAATLETPTAGDFSFVVLGEATDNTADYLAGCTAYVAASKVDSKRPPVLYIDDLVVSPNGQSKRLGILAFREVLARAGAHSQNTIEFRARHSTSYKGFRGPVMARILGGMGYASTDHGVVATYGEAPNVEYSHLIEIQKQS